MVDLFTDGGAEFSECRTYRYLLWREWGPEPWLACLMLNPPTDAEHRNDPTNERCERRARAMGFGGVSFPNLFPFMAATPQEMRRADDPIGPREVADSAIYNATVRVGMVLCGWGNHGAYLNRDQEVLKMLFEENIDLHYLELTKAGQPKHPLYVPYAVKPVVWRYEPPRANIDALETEDAAHG